MKRIIVLMTLAALSLSLAPAAFAASERVALTSSLTYRGDGQGTYLFKGNGKLEGAVIASDGAVESLGAAGTYELIIPYKAKDLISGITINWKFSGKVKLEVSATGEQLTYVPVTNGVPLERRDFTGGANLKWRATLAAASKLAEVRIVYTTVSGMNSTWGAPELSGFKFRKPIYIKGTEAGELFNYQVPIKVAESTKAGGYDVVLKGIVQSDFSDARFTQADKETLLSFWRESVQGQAPDRVATFWVKIPQLPKNGLLIYVYYGKPAAEDLSSGSGTFDFFEDFSAAAFDTKKWQAYDFTGRIIEYKLKTGAEVKTLEAKDLTKDEIIDFFKTAKDLSWARARQPADPVPQIDITKTGLAPALAVNLAEFSGVTVAGNGDLVLDARHSEGEYLSPVVYTAFPVRIGVPKWKAAIPDTSSAAVDISATGVAEEFKKDCASEKYYYASRKDFKEGKSLRWKVRLGRKSISSSTSRLQEFSLDYLPGAITLIKPDGREKIKVGSDYGISWSAWEYEPSYKMKLEYSIDGGKTYQVIMPALNNTGTYSWRVPNAISAKALVKVSDALDPKVFDVSGGVFAISEGPSEAETGLETSETGIAEEGSAEETAQTTQKDEEETKKTRTGVKPYEVLIKRGNSGSYEEGDIIMIKPAGFLWGASEKNNFYIIPAHLTDTQAEEFMKPQEAAGRKDKDGQFVRDIIRQRKYKVNLHKKGVLEQQVARAKGAAESEPALDTSEIVDKSTVIESQR
ncbi:MAG: DUF2341 domain-containing protein [Candidatus Omnitrophica bacterium]|nr:DUF2341 domain-containing protein [Candidatus Omnitrophota bacterium]